MDWRGDVNNGAVIGEFVCSGFIYPANVGWIHLGDGLAGEWGSLRERLARGLRCQPRRRGNTVRVCVGRKYWVAVTNHDATGAAFARPRIDLASGRLSGFVWSANCGWISLSNAVAFVQTDSLSTTSGEINPSPASVQGNPTLTSSRSCTKYWRPGRLVHVMVLAVPSAEALKNVIGKPLAGSIWLGASLKDRVVVDPLRLIGSSACKRCAR